MADPVAPTEPDNIPSFAEPYPDDDTQSELEFAGNANRFSTWLPSIVANLNAMLSWVKTTADQVFGNATIAADSATSAADSATAAAGLTNFEGEWSELSGPFTKHHSCENNGVRYYAKVAIADIAAAEPTGESATWGIVIGSAGKRSVKDAGDGYTDADIPSVGLQRELQAYKGQWWRKAGPANPPYFVSHGGGANLFAKSGDLTDELTWLRTRLSVNSGLLAPDGTNTAFGLVANSEVFSHQISQVFDYSFSVGDLIVFSFLLAPGVSDKARVLITGDAFDTQYISADLNLTDESHYVITGTVADMGMFEDEEGYYFCWVAAAATDAAASARAYIRIDGASFEGDEVSNYLKVWRPQIEPGLIPTYYKETDDLPIPYSPDTLYQLLKPLSNVKSITPGSDANTWRSLGSGGGLSAGDVQVFTSADEDGSGNIAVTLDAKNENFFDLDFRGTPLPTGSGAFQITVENIDTSTVASGSLNVRGADLKTLSLVFKDLAGSTITKNWVKTPEFSNSDTEFELIGYWYNRITGEVDASLIDGR